MKSIDRFWRNVTRVAAGSAAAQAVPILASPIITRLFVPSEFGQLALYASVLGVVAVLATLKLELSVVVAPAQKLSDVLGAAMASIATTTVLLSVALTFLPSPWAQLGLPASWRIPFVLSVLLAACILVFQALLNREEEFHTVARARVLESTSSTALKIFLGTTGYGAHGLLAATLAAQVGTLAILTRRSWQRMFLLVAQVSSLSVRDGLATSRRFIVFTLPSSFLEMVSTSLPIVSIGILFGAAEAGLFALANRVLRVPLGVISGATGEVLRSRAARLVESEGRLLDLYVGVLRILGLWIIVPTVLLAAFAAPAFGVIFGEQWTRAGEMAAIMSPLFAMQFVVHPLGQILLVTNRQHIDLAIQVFLILGTFAAFFLVAALGGSLKHCLGAYVAVYCAKYAVELAGAYTASVHPVR